MNEAEVAVVNSGRNVTAAVMHRAWTIIERNLPAQGLLGAVEIREADKGYDELQIFRDTVGKDRHIHGAHFHEVLVAGTEWRVVHQAHVHAAAGVPKQGPARDVHVYVMERLGLELAYLLCHFPTHAYNKPVVPAMKHQYDLMYGVLHDELATILGQGTPAILGTDANNQHLPQLHRSQVPLNVHPPDYLLGFGGVTLVKQWSKPLPIEKAHQLRGARIRVGK